jgi:sugar phosphate isomerase/epimerase
MYFIKNFKIGLKLWSINSDLVPETVKLYKKGYFDYIELYVVPRTYALSIDKWASLKVPFVIHCSHSGHGFNLADAKLRETNKLKFEEVKAFTDTLKSNCIITHLGNNGLLDETIAQLNAISDNRICAENKPLEGLKGEVCVGCLPDEIQKVLQETRIKGFVLDLGHAFYAANSIGTNPYDFIERFLKLNPKMFHLSDGLINSTKDCHYNLGEGNFDLAKMISYIPKDSKVTLEIPYNFDSQFMQFKQNVKYVKERYSKKLR